MSGEIQAARQITESDQELLTLIKGMSPLLLAVAAVHLSGNLDILEGIHPKLPAFNGDVSGSLSPEEEALIRARAFPIVKAYRDAGCPAPYRPTKAQLHKMMNFVTGLDLPESYVPMIEEDMALDGQDCRAFHWTRPVSEAAKSQFPVIVIGAGMSGMLIGLRLKQAGLPFIIVEKNEDVGGTWFENQYPGLRVDVPSHAYSFSFTQDHRWPNLYSFQSELIAYFRKCAERFEIGSHIRFGVEVTEAAWSEDESLWQVTTRRSDGIAEILQARALVSAVGFLNRPYMPQFDGADTFKGPQFHTARWRHDVPLAGKRVAVIGNAATSLQLIPEVAKVAAHLTVFQRSPSWTMVLPKYSRTISDGEQWAIENLPGYSAWMRVGVFNWTLDLSPGHMQVDVKWPQNGKSTSLLNEQARQRLTADYERLLAGRPDLLAKLLPDYPPFVKRPTLSDGNFFAAIKQDNVALVTDAIDRITEAGVLDETGRLHEADVIVYATGFQVQKFLSPMVIRGRGGITLNDYWADRPGGYLGIVVPRFPNFFMMYGPGTNLGYNGNLIFNSEVQARYIAHCIRFAVEENQDALEVRQEAFDEYMERTGRKLEEFVWSTSYGTTYFRNAQGRVTTNSPWSLMEMWTWTQNPKPEDFLSGGTNSRTPSKMSAGS